MTFQHAFTLFGLCTVLLSPQIAHAASENRNKVIASKRGAIIVADGNNTNQSCYYDDKRYSLGSVLQIDEVYIECVAKNDFEMNGALVWQTILFGEAKVAEEVPTGSSGKKVYKTP
jgi:hypothetical protein